MVSLISNLITPAALPSPRSAAQAAIVTGTDTQLPLARTPLRAKDSFSVTVGAKQALEIGALTGARHNAGEGASLLQIAATGLGEISDALTRMEELAEEAETSSYSRGERAIMNAEFDALRSEIDDIVDRTEFNDIKVLEGISLDFKVGTGNAGQDSITVSISAAAVADLDADLASDRIDDESSASDALTNVTNAIDVLSDIQAAVDGAGVRFQAAQQNLASNENILSALRADLIDRPVTIGTADNLADVVSQEFLARAAPAAVGFLSSAGRVLLSSSQLQAIEPSQAADPTPSQEEPQTKTKAVKRPSAYETAPRSNKSSSPSETPHSVDFKA
jgi:flagellin